MAVARLGEHVFVRPENVFSTLSRSVSMSCLISDRARDPVPRHTPNLVGDPVPSALAAMRAGVPVVLFDDDDREGEADLIVAADRLTVATMARLIRDCSGIVCLCMTGDHADRLELPPMVEHNGSRHGTAFTVSIEAKAGVTTGVSAADRCQTIRAAVAADARPGDLARPGHVFPLRAHDQGLLARRGHTEGAVELARMAGLQPAAVLCELMNPDGTMMQRAEALAYAARHGLPHLTIEDLARSPASAGA
jgi:3,4-dihydroxy 2-butanone 4-phosphate synthase